MEERQQLLAENRELRRLLEEPTPEKGMASRETESEEEEEGSQLSRVLPMHQDQVNSVLFCHSLSHFTSSSL